MRLPPVPEALAVVLALLRPKDPADPQESREADSDEAFGAESGNKAPQETCGTSRVARGVHPHPVRSSAVARGVNAPPVGRSAADKTRQRLWFRMARRQQVSLRVRPSEIHNAREALRTEYLAGSITFDTWGQERKRLRVRYSSPLCSCDGCKSCSVTPSLRRSCSRPAAGVTYWRRCAAFAAENHAPAPDHKRHIEQR